MPPATGRQAAFAQQDKAATAAAAAAAVAASEALADDDEETTSSPDPRAGKLPSPLAPIVDSPCIKDGERRRHTRNNSGGGGGSSPFRINAGSAPTGPTRANDNVAAAAGGFLCWRRTQRLLWAFWRRRTVQSLRAHVGRRLARLLRHTWGRRLVAAVSIFTVALLWFLAITAVVGPAGGGRGRRRGGGGTGKRGSGGGDGGDGHPSYYRRITVEAAVGPSLSDPWKVREIDIAAADWGDYDGHGSSGGGGGMGENGAGGEGGSGGWKEWDGQVNSVLTGELEPVGGAKTRPKVDLLLTIFSVSTEVRNNTCVHVCAHAASQCGSIRNIP